MAFEAGTLNDSEATSFRVEMSLVSRREGILSSVHCIHCSCSSFNAEATYVLSLLSAGILGLGLRSLFKQDIAHIRSIIFERSRRRPVFVKPESRFHIISEGT